MLHPHDLARNVIGVAALDDLRLPLDGALYDRIVADVAEHGSHLVPAEPWQEATLFRGDEARGRRPSFQDLVVPWIGFGQRPASEPQVAETRAFLEEVAPGFRLPAGLETAMRNAEKMAVGDLWTATEVGLITAHATAHDRPLRVLEIGGGYGRLVEGLLGVSGLSVQCVMVDAVPASLYYAHAYLTHRLPARRVASWYVDGPDAAADADAYIVPPWHLGDVRDGFDVASNVSSFQEMNDDQIATYLQLIDEAVRSDGLVYLCNSRIYKWPREYAYPPTWRYELKANSPTAFSLDRPVELLRRCAVDCSEHNQRVQERYLASSYQEFRSAAEQRIAELRAGLERAQERAAEAAAEAQRMHRAMLESRRDAESRIRAEVERRQVLVERLSAERDVAQRRAEEAATVLERTVHERDVARRRADEGTTVLERTVRERDAARRRAAASAALLERTLRERDLARQRAEAGAKLLERTGHERDSARRRAEQGVRVLERTVRERDIAQRRAQERGTLLERTVRERDIARRRAEARATVLERTLRERDIARRRAEAPATVPEPTMPEAALGERRTRPSAD
jgi:hypothetical protein